MTIRTQLKAGRLAGNHNEPLRVRSTVRAGKIAINHSEPLQVRSALKAGKLSANHSESLRVRSTLKAGGVSVNHNETQRATDRPAVSMRRELLTTSRKEDRLELLVVRAGLRAGRRARVRVRR
jgi:hypothetical protein